MEDDRSRSKSSLLLWQCGQGVIEHFFWIASKQKLEGELGGARAADLIQRIEAATLAAASERGSEHLSGLPEERRAEIVCGRAKIGVVEDVEKIRSRLKRKPLPELELPP